MEAEDEGAESRVWFEEEAGAILVSFLQRLEFFSENKDYKPFDCVDITVSIGIEQF